MSGSCDGQSWYDNFMPEDVYYYDDDDEDEDKEDDCDMRYKECWKCGMDYNQEIHDRCPSCFGLLC